ncbi:MAG TPA: gas vesicle structural protein GvpA [Ktedonobacterales bacterium]
MSMARAETGGARKQEGGGGQNSMLLELVDRILDKGIVIDAWARVSLLSIELLTIEARVVVASVDTYLRYAEAIGNTALASMPRPQSAQQGRVTQAGGQQPQQQGQGQQPQQQQGQPQQGRPQQALPAPQAQNMMPPQGQPQQAQPQPAIQQQPQQAAQPQQGLPQQGQPQQMPQQH